MSVGNDMVEMDVVDAMKSMGISEMSVLDNDQRSKLVELSGVFRELILGHTTYQINNFIVGQFITPDRKQRQCVQELWKRVRGLFSHHYNYIQLQIRLERENVRIERCRKELDGQLAPLERRERELDISEAENEISKLMFELTIVRVYVSELWREIMVFYDAYEELVPERKYDNYEDAEHEYWLRKYRMGRSEGKRGDALSNTPEEGNGDTIDG